MESHSAALRLKLILGKYRVIRVERAGAFLRFALELQEGIKIVCEIPATADVKEGDLLTLYTEVLCHPSTH
jgi:hypothetical protein